jgi:hypothetical protein
VNAPTLPAKRKNFGNRPMGLLGSAASARAPKFAPANILQGVGARAISLARGVGADRDPAISRAPQDEAPGARKFAPVAIALVKRSICRQRNLRADLSRDDYANAITEGLFRNTRRIEPTVESVRHIRDKET